jgi:S-adenosylmethionine hydrolase
VWSLRRIIALLTDYGYRDPYVGVVKAVIKSINPDVEIIDLTHGVGRHSIVEAAVLLAVSARYFPKGTVFLVVVDPGVGGPRRGIVVETSNYILVGPDNGCLTLLAEEDGVKRVFDITNSKYRLPVVSHTFHGRDVFAPIAAWISLGVPLEELGVEVEYSGLNRISIEKPRVRREERAIEASVLYIDVYGNVMTNVKAGDLTTLNPSVGSTMQLIAKNRSYKCTYVPSFSWVREGEIACYINSWGYLEIAVNKGEASTTLGLSIGDKIVVAIPH